MALSRNDEMNLERWQRAKELLDVASEMTPSDREAYLRDACGEDEDLYREVQSLLESLTLAGDFLAESGTSPAKPEEPPADPPAFADGDCIAERFQIVQFIGRGGMGEVYKAIDRRLDEHIAIKVILPDLLSKNTIARFRQEVLLGRRVTHPNVCRVFDLEQFASPKLQSEIIFLTMEFLEGETLRARLNREGTLPVPESLAIISQIAAALAASHAAGVIHRDLKPSNVILASTDAVNGRRAVITDFGVAQLIDNQRRAGHSLTGSHEVVGTFDYMAPEQAESGQISSATDIYALGLIMYEMLTGQKPFSGGTPLSRLAQRVKGPPVSPRTHVKDMDFALESLILSCLAVDPAQRIQDAAVIATAVENFGTPAGRSRNEPQLAAPTQCSIAVLPFLNLTSDPENEYFSDGLTEELIGALNRVEGLRVVARTSAFLYRNRSVDIRQVARELNIEMAVEGAVRRAGKRLRISVQLVNATEGYQLWSDQYDRQMEDVFAVQEEIANIIASKLKMRLGNQQASPIVQHRTQNIEAYHLFLKGRFHSNQRTPSGLRKAGEHFKQAVQLDSHFAPAWAALADCWVVQGVYGIRPPQEVFPLAKETAFRALAIEPQMADALCAAGCVQAIYDWEWAPAEQCFQRALEEDSNYAAAHHSYALYCLLPQGRYKEARSHLERALINDPLSLAINISVAVQLYFERRYEEAIRECEKVLEMDPNFGMAFFFQGQMYEQMRKYPEALAALERAVTLTESSPEALAWLGRIYALSGEVGKARLLLNQLNAASACKQYISPVLFAQLSLGLGEVETALDQLERASTLKAADLIWMGVRPVFDSLRSEPRFQNICRQLRLPMSVHD